MYTYVLEEKSYRTGKPIRREEIDCIEEHRVGIVPCSPTVSEEANPIG